MKRLDRKRAADLRYRALAVLEEQGPPLSANQITETLGTVRQLVHDLHVHQVELEMQNDELLDAQGALEASKRRYADLYDFAPVGYCTLDDEGRLLEVNRTLADLLGIPWRQLLGGPFAAHVVRDDADQIHLLRKQALESAAATRDAEASALVDRPLRRELRLQKADGSHLWVQLAMTVAVDRGVRPPASSVDRAQPGDRGQLCWVVVTDIDARRRAEQALEQESAIRAHILESVPAGVAMVDGDGAIVAANRSWSEDRQGSGSSALRVGDNFLQACDEAAAITPTDLTAAGTAGRAEELAVGLRSVLSGEIGRFSAELPSAGPREQQWLELIATPLPDVPTANGPGAILMALDVTDRRRGELRFRRLVESNVQGVLYWRLDGAILGANDAFLTMVGLDRADLQRGLNLASLTPTDAGEPMVDALRASAASGSGKPIERRLRTAGGATVPVLLGATLLEDGSEEGVAFMVDLTERKEIEALMLRGQRLESIGTLAGGVAHDLNNMLAPVTMSVDLLRGSLSDPEDLELVDVIVESTERCAQLVQQILRYSRGTGEKRDAVDLLKVLRDVVQIVRETFPKSIELRFLSGREALFVAGDETLLHQVFLNLCVNARDAMPEGGTLTIAVGQEPFEKGGSPRLSAESSTESSTGSSCDSAEEHVVVRLTDTGCGMAPEVLDRIFEPFYTTKEVGSGTGLGLSTANGIVERHGGSLRVDSTPGEGSTFEVFLPTSAGLGLMATGDTSPAEDLRGHGEVVLLVDDEESILKVAGDLLERSGYGVLLALHGGHALDLYDKDGGVDLVLTDLAMPTMSGEELIDALLTRDPDLPIVASSGLASGRAVDQMKRLGLRNFLPKPYTGQQLLEVVAAVFRGSDEP